MRIAVNVRALIADRVDGIGRFTYEVFNRITNAHQEHQFIFIFDRPFPRKFIFSANITPVVAIPCRHPILWYIWFEYVVPHVLSKHRADIFVSPDGFLSLATNVPSLPVMHDFSFYHYPNHLPLSISRYYNYFFPKYAQKANLIATVSEFSKHDIARICCQPLDKIEVIYNGASSVFGPLVEGQRSATRNLFAGGRPYFLYVGTLHPRKNIARLIRAFDEFKTAYHSDTAMILAGPRMFKTADIQRAYDRMRHKADLIFAGPVSDEQLPKLYGAAIALTYVPVFEGFGLPIIEAMRCHVPVITSDCSSIPEVCEGAAIQVDPCSVDAIVKAMASVAFDEDLCSRLIRAGSARAKCFSWQRTSTLLWECINRVMNRTDG
jgi:glycosyltransferase involved in cell wall biosynthesis